MKKPAMSPAPITATKAYALVARATRRSVRVYLCCDCSEFAAPRKTHRASAAQRDNKLGLSAVRRRLRYQSLEGLHLILQAPFDILQPRRCGGISHVKET